jgi:hypothetical protein
LFLQSFALLALITTATLAPTNPVVIGQGVVAPTLLALFMDLVLLPLLNVEGVKLTANVAVRLVVVRMVSAWESKVTRSAIFTWTALVV